ncbi:TPA: NTP transferase domain-containing protein [Candidatus Bathyarchaeota archaeon]|nr:NTP transferase domain-containing protein [Candidatus Bathyarchaeota archaeon]
MGVTAVLMAGGKGSRMQHSEEKPLVRLEGRPIIELVIRSLQNAKRVESIIVAVSHHTPRTAAFVTQFPVNIVSTPGNGYIQDLQYLVKQLNLRKVLTVAADIPLVTGQIIDEIVEKYESCGKPALAVVTSLEAKQKLGIGSEHSFKVAEKTVVPVGINIIDGRKIEDQQLEQEVFLMDKMEVAVNVNTLEELALAKRLFKEI